MGDNDTGLVPWSAFGQRRNFRVVATEGVGDVTIDEPKTVETVDADGAVVCVKETEELVFSLRNEIMHNKRITAQVDIVDRYMSNVRHQGSSFLGVANCPRMPLALGHFHVYMI